MSGRSFRTRDESSIASEDDRTLVLQQRKLLLTDVATTLSGQKFLGSS